MKKNEADRTDKHTPIDSLLLSPGALNLCKVLNIATIEDALQPSFDTSNLKGLWMMHLRYLVSEIRLALKACGYDNESLSKMLEKVEKKDG